MEITDLQIVRELGSQRCRCGCKKNRRMTFCSKCYYSLPPALRKKLYSEAGDGYEEAYREAEPILNEKGRPRAS